MLNSYPDLPLERYVALDTSSQATAQHEVRKVMFPRTVAFEPVGEARQFHLTINSLEVGAFKLCAVGSTGHWIRLVDEQHVATLVPLRHAIEIDDGLGPMKAAPGEAILTGRPRRLTMLSPDYLGLVLLTSREKLAAHREMVQARPGRQDMTQTQLPGTRDAAAALGRYIQFLTQELDRSDALVRSARLRNATSALLMELVSGSYDAVEHDDAAPRRAVAPWQVARAEAYMRQNASQSLTMADVAAHIGTSLRSLQLAFQRYHGIAPRTYLEACRLDLAHERLMHAAPGVSVTEIAYDCGVVHPGRFAARYSQRFGERPSETLRRSWRKA